MVTRQFLLAGKAIFTVTSATGQWVTYRITHKPGSERYAPAWFVSALTGSDNENDYTYLGLLDAETGAVRVTAKSGFTEDSLQVRVVRWALREVWAGRDLPEGYSIRHAGCCGRCGATLTTPDSLATGLGPECRRKSLIG